MLHYYVNIHTNIIGIWILLLLGICLLKSKWQAYLKISDFIYEVYFFTNRPFTLSGFLDTGNNVRLDDIPVIFVDHKYKNRFVNLPSKMMDVYTLNGVKKRNVYLCEVSIKRYKRQLYYICCEEAVLLEFNCECLLNLES